jgi:hypothetical protein
MGKCFLCWADRLVFRRHCRWDHRLCFDGVRIFFATVACAALVFAAPAAVAGYAMIYGVTGEAGPSEVWWWFCRDVAVIRPAGSFR